MSEVILWVSIVLMVVGALGTLLPILPGTPMMFLVALAYGWYEGFNLITSLTLTALFILMVLTLIIDYISGVFGAKKYGATRYGTIGSFIGGILGFVFFNLPGVIIGPLVGAVVGEIIAGKNLREASTVGLGTLFGIAVGSALRFSLALAMAVTYIYKVL